MHPTIASLLQSAPVITDGAWGTLLQSLGLRAGEHPDLWNISHPERVREVPTRYVAAGSRVVLTNTFRSNTIALGPAHNAESVASINKAGVQLSRSAAGSSAAVFASVGPSGKMLIAGDVTAGELEAAFLQQAEAIAQAGADAIVLETMTDLDEAVVALRACKHTSLPVVVSMVFDSGKDKDRTMMGKTPEQVAEALTAAGADVIGANCGVGIDGYIPVCVRLRKATPLPLWIKPNAGLPEMVNGKATYAATPDQFAQKARELRDAGADFIGGCCGTTPDFIRAVARTFYPT